MVWFFFIFPIQLIIVCGYTYLTIITIILVFLYNSLFTTTTCTLYVCILFYLHILRILIPCSSFSPILFTIYSYYFVFQFFLSNRAVYFLVWNVRLGHEHAGLKFWLSSISVHAPKAPVLIVGTHIDQVSFSKKIGIWVR